MMRAEKRNELYEFIALYVRKVYSDTLITRELHCMTGCFFLDWIRPGDIAYVIALVKNGGDMWDQTLRMRALGAAAHKEKEKKLRPLFTSGIGKKKEQGKHLWSKEGIKYFKQAETEWVALYKDEKLMRILYSGCESWLEKKGKEMMVKEDSDKNLHSVMATWTEDEKAKKKGVGKGNNNDSKIGLGESENEEEDGYSLYMDLRKTPSRRWSKNAWRKSNGGYSTPDDKRGGESEEEVSRDERDRARKRRKVGKNGDGGIGGVKVSPAKYTRSSTQGRKEK
jgi:hypothetical protein